MKLIFLFEFVFLNYSDECVNFALQKGFDASRSKIKYFRHNDWQHLEQLLEQQEAEDKKVGIIKMKLI